MRENDHETEHTHFARVSGCGGTTTRRCRGGWDVGVVVVVADALQWKQALACTAATLFAVLHRVGEHVPAYPRFEDRTLLLLGQALADSANHAHDKAHGGGNNWTWTTFAEISSFCICVAFLPDSVVAASTMNDHANLQQLFGRQVAAVPRIQPRHTPTTCRTCAC